MTELAKFILCSALFFICTAFPAEDEVLNLPGLSAKPTFRHFSGYLQGKEKKRLHYWFVESERSPSKDPVLLWMNGGPGCSSMEGMLAEHGPFMISEDGATLKQNPYSWNKIANVLYLESPAGVGFSIADDKVYATSDDEEGEAFQEDHHVCLSHISTQAHSAYDGRALLFPEYKSNDFYVTGESYGGVYVPTLSIRVLNDPSFNFKGFAVGNGISDFDINDNSMMYYGYYHGLFSQTEWLEMIHLCCKNSNSTIGNCDFSTHATPDCAQVSGKIYSRLNNLNIYNIYGECYHPQKNLQNVVTAKLPTLFTYKIPGASVAGSAGSAMTVRDQEIQQLKQIMDKNVNVTVKLVIPCVNDTAITTYMNREDVKKSLHIPSGLDPWAICSDKVSASYTRQYNTVKDVYLKILNSQKARILVYNGDFDMACNYLGDEWFVESLKLKELNDWEKWLAPGQYGDDQVAGFYKKYSNLTFVTVKGAGHMVPTDKPRESLVLLQNFLSGKF